MGGWDKKRSGTADHRNRQARIFANAGYRCEIQWEGCTFTAEVLDHIIALGLGGADDTDANYQASCVKCSSTKASIEAHLASGHAVEMPEREDMVCWLQRWCRSSRRSVSRNVSRPSSRSDGPCG